MKASPILQRFNQPFLFLLVIGVGLFFFRLGVPGLMDPDEGRYAEIAREMLVSGDFITPQLNFLPYLEKPPLVYWLTALSLSVGGLNEWAARFMPALSAIGGVLAVYWLAAKLWGAGTGFWQPW
jgi:4-amino-4-deoxy-L-arabinose transferase-like glycosyltransferase